MEEKEEKITLFILGDIKTEKGHYLARIIKTQKGVYTTRFEPRTNTVKVKYNPIIISKEKIERLSYFSDCAFVSDKHDIEKQIWFLQTQRTLKRLLQISNIASIVLILYFISCFFMGSPVAYFGYICLVVTVFISAVTYYLYKKIKGRRFTEQNNKELL